MSLGLAEYLNHLDERSDLIWPLPPDPVPLKAKPFVAPLPGIRLVTFSLYGTLLQIDQGQLVHTHSQPLRMQIALEKTIKEFNMWNSMTRKAGQPWESMLRQYDSIATEVGMAATKRRGDVLEIDSCKIWKRVLERLVKNEYVWDEDKFGDLEDLAAKVAYFFHASLQGTAPMTDCGPLLAAMRQQGIRAGLIADAQVFSLPQFFFQLRKQWPSLGPDVLSADCVVLSTQVGVKKPSETLYRVAVERFSQLGITPSEVLHVSHRLRDDLAVAKKYGFHTVLFAADKNCCHVQSEDLRNPDWKPARLITQLSQLRDILTI